MDCSLGLEHANTFYKVLVLGEDFQDVDTGEGVSHTLWVMGSPYTKVCGLAQPFSSPIES